MLFFDVSYVKIGMGWRNLVGEDQALQIKFETKAVKVKKCGFAEIN